MARQLKHKIDDEFSILLSEEDSKLVAATRLTQDLKKAASQLSASEARYYVDMYYALQKMRMGAGAQIREARKAGEPSNLLQWTYMVYDKLESDVKSALQVYAEQSQVGQWSLSIIGIGPVIAAGLLAHIDIEKAPSAGHIWRYAGLDPTVRWEKKQKQPWNAELKNLSWKAGQSFVKFSGNPKCLYGQLYRQRKAYEVEANHAGKFADQAKRALTEKNYGKDTEAYAAYSQGRLPDAQLEARAERYAVKIFLSHWHGVAYEVKYGKAAPTPWVIEYGGHTDRLSIPNWPMDKA